jgi:hypothetical protein
MHKKIIALRDRHRNVLVDKAQIFYVNLSVISSEQLLSLSVDNFVLSSNNPLPTTLAQ